MLFLAVTGVAPHGCEQHCLLGNVPPKMQREDHCPGGTFREESIHWVGQKIHLVTGYKNPNELYGQPNTTVASGKASL